VGRRRLAAYARMAELLHNRVRAETPRAALELPPVVLLTATGIICGKVTSIWGYLSRLRVSEPSDGPARAATEALLTDPNLQVGTEPVALNRIRTIYLVDVSVSPPGDPTCGLTSVSSQCRSTRSWRGRWILMASIRMWRSHRWGRAMS
jgi:hypothetical protein